MSELQEGVQIQELLSEEEVPVQVWRPEVLEVSFPVGVSESEEGHVQPEGPLETRAESLPRPHPPQK